MEIILTIIAVSGTLAGTFGGAYYQSKWTKDREFETSLLNLKVKAYSQLTSLTRTLATGTFPEMKKNSFTRIASEAKLFSSENLEDKIVEFVNSVQFVGPDSEDKYFVQNKKEDLFSSLRELEKELKKELKIK